MLRLRLSRSNCEWTSECWIALNWSEIVVWIAINLLNGSTIFNCILKLPAKRFLHVIKSYRVMKENQPAANFRCNNKTNHSKLLWKWKQTPCLCVSVGMDLNAVMVKAIKTYKQCNTGGDDPHGWSDLKSTTNKEHNDTIPVLKWPTLQVGELCAAVVSSLAVCRCVKWMEVSKWMDIQCCHVCHLLIQMNKQNKNGTEYRVFSSCLRKGIE